jgi:hypothetical protein
MFTKRNQSAWTFSTSSSVSGGGPVYGPLGYTTSQVTLVFTAPDGAIVEFEYWSAGPSVGLPKSFPSSLTGSTRGDFSTGVIYVSSSFSGSELSIEDFKGFTLIEEASVGVWDGHSGTIMFLGVPLIHMPMEIVNNTGALGIGAQLAVDHPTIARVLASIANPLGGSHLTGPEASSANSFKTTPRQPYLCAEILRDFRFKPAFRKALAMFGAGTSHSEHPFRPQALGSSP